MKTALVLLLALCFIYGSSAQTKKPNVIIINADDLGYGDVSCYGATKIQTPNIDALAAQGIRLTNAHSSAFIGGHLHAFALFFDYR
jgi:hypothetical protein